MYMCRTSPAASRWQLQASGVSGPEVAGNSADPPRPGAQERACQKNPGTDPLEAALSKDHGLQHIHTGSSTSGIYTQSSKLQHKPRNSCKCGIASGARGSGAARRGLCGTQTWRGRSRLTLPLFLVVGRRSGSAFLRRRPDRGFLQLEAAPSTVHEPAQYDSIHSTDTVPEVASGVWATRTRAKGTRERESEGDGPKESPACRQEPQAAKE